MFKAFTEPFRHPYPKFDQTSKGNETGEKGQTSRGRKRKAKPKNWSATLGRIWLYLAKRKLKLMLVLLMVVFSSALSLLGPYLIGIAVDDYLEGAVTGSGFNFCLGLVLYTCCFH